MPPLQKVIHSGDHPRLNKLPSDSVFLADLESTLLGRQEPLLAAIENFNIPPLFV